MFEPRVFMGQNRIAGPLVTKIGYKSLWVLRESVRREWKQCGVHVVAVGKHSVYKRLSTGRVGREHRHTAPAPICATQLSSLSPHVTPIHPQYTYAFHHCWKTHPSWPQSVSKCLNCFRFYSANRIGTHSKKVSYNPLRPISATFLTNTVDSPNKTTYCCPQTQCHEKLSDGQVTSCTTTPLDPHSWNISDTYLLKWRLKRVGPCCDVANLNLHASHYLHVWIRRDSIHEDGA